MTYKAPRNLPAAEHLNLIPSPLRFLYTLLFLPRDLCTAWSRCLKALSLVGHMAYGLSSSKPLLKPYFLREAFPDDG